MKIKINIFALLILSVSVVTIFVVFWIQFIEKIQPCELCSYQRWPYYILVFLSIIIFFIKNIKKNFFISILITLILLISSILAIYHTGIEQNFWSGITACSDFTKITANDIDELRKRILDVPITRCDLVSWKFLIFSLSNLNSIISLALFIISLLLNIEILKRFDEM
ncbi:MAG: Disulfide bond formation protein B [Alphaproteobacteria bacterium MarineAlpha2_Bin1]|nr:MAG: Disulfide bond formation protein B [Alphaproteobacteria bacterium MarineAlpha2_Bin1]